MEAHHRLHLTFPAKLHYIAEHLLPGGVEGRGLNPRTHSGQAQEAMGHKPG